MNKPCLPFSTVLIANRGEIACRVANTSRRLGLQTVAVYSDADAQARHVQVCDRAYALGGNTAAESYLQVEKIFAVAARAANGNHGSVAIHPGYGFLSENAAFAQACHARGFIFIGPPASAIAAMGDKSAAKTLMQQAAVPLVPGYHGDQQAPDFLQQAADQIGYPVLIKASAGGGGKGMRIVERASDFLDALRSCQREAQNAFSNPKVLVEKYIGRPRHIEIQLFADTHGNVVYLFERDCSIQRRHQKVLEEAPAPGISDATRQAMGAAAVAAAKAVGYVGAGTVEFIYDVNSGEFYFMEMNTRLQVEHPVTEMITGLDLVEWQLRVAAGEALPLTQAQLQCTGHAIEARLYAEQPEKDFLPSTGQLQYCALPNNARVQEPVGEFTHIYPLRVDSGVGTGSEITPLYDPMIAKLIAWGPDRASALRNLDKLLQHTQVVGVHTNTRFLRQVVNHPSFQAAELDTGFIPRHQSTLLPPLAVHEAHVLLATAAQLLSEEPAPVSDWQDPFAHADSWAMLRNSLAPRQLRFAHGQAIQTVQVKASPSERVVEWQGQSACLTYHAEPLVVAQQRGWQLTVQWGARTLAGSAIETRSDHAVGWQIFTRDAGLEQQALLRYLDPRIVHAITEETHGSNNLLAPMPGKIIALLAPLGSPVTAGTPLLVMEAMKMEHTLRAPQDGTVQSWCCAVGQQVADGAKLMEFELSVQQAAVESQA